MPKTKVIKGISKWLETNLFGGNDGCVGCQWKVDAGVGDQVGLKFGQIDI